jgi:uncharacterized Zn finger protein
VILIWGSRGLTSELGRGEFYCPQCMELNVPYRHKSVREWFTLYFIPIFPIGGKTTYVECEGCRGTFKDEVLDIEPPTETQILVTKLAEKMDRGMSLEEAEERLAEQGFTKEQAREVVDSVAGDGVWSCSTCGEHYMDQVRKCRVCDKKGK